MANQEHLNILTKGVEVWNKWRCDNLGVFPDLEWANLSGQNLDGVRFNVTNLDHADLTGAHLTGAMLAGARLIGAKLSNTVFTNASLLEANFGGADLSNSDLSGANLQGANLSEANLSGAVLSSSCLHHAKLLKTNLTGAILHEADLQGAILLNCDMQGADLTGSSVYGISAWKLNLTNAKQFNLIITPYDEMTITVDNLEIAQFIYLLLNHKKIRDVITTIGEKAVLILGRFTQERKEILDLIAERLRELKYLPIIFDFKKIPGQSYTATIKILAGLSKFVIADITRPKSIPQEAQAIIPEVKVPFVRIIQKGELAWSMSEDFNSYDWVIEDVIEYSNKDMLVDNLAAVVDLAEHKHKQLMKKDAKRTLKTLSIEELGNSRKICHNPIGETDC